MIFSCHRIQLSLIGCGDTTVKYVYDNVILVLAILINRNHRHAKNFCKFIIGGIHDMRCVLIKAHAAISSLATALANSYYDLILYPTISPGLLVNLAILFSHSHGVVLFQDICVSAIY